MKTEKNLDKFLPGDLAVAKDFIRFSDGSIHAIGQKIAVTEQNQDYFNTRHDEYDRIGDFVSNPT
jgi:hypothetical protein